MPTFKTATATRQDSALPQDRLQGNIITGELRIIEAVYTATGTEAASGDIIDICDVPPGASVIPELCRVAHEASLGGSAVAIPKLGDALNDDRYSATPVSLDSSTAGNQAFTAAIATSVIPRFVVTEATKRIKATFSRTNAITAGKKIQFWIAYRLP